MNRSWWFVIAVGTACMAMRVIPALLLPEGEVARVSRAVGFAVPAMLVALVVTQVGLHSVSLRSALPLVTGIAAATALAWLRAPLLAVLVGSAAVTGGLRLIT